MCRPCGSPSPSRMLRHASSALLGDGVTRIVQRGLDGFQRDVAGVVLQVDRLGRNVGAHRLDAGKRAKRTVDRLHTVLAAHVGNRQHYLLYLSHRESLLSLWEASGLLPQRVIPVALLTGRRRARDTF